jgi:hypothetical protein
MADDFIPDSEEIIGYEEVDEEKFYRPWAIIHENQRNAWKRTGER